MIPGQFPVQLAIKPGLLQTLALKPGQLFDAVVIGPGKPGLTEVLVGKQQMSLALLTPPSAGTTLRMRVDLTSVGPRFVVVAQTPPPAAGGVPAAVPVAAEQSQGSQVAQTGAKAMPQPNPAPMQAPPPSQGSATIIERAPPEIALPGAPQPQGLKPGQVVEVRVLGTNQAGKTEVSFGKQQMSLPLPGNPPAGTILQLRVEATPVGPRFVVMAQTPPQAAGASASAPMPATAQTPLPNAGRQNLPQNPVQSIQQAPTIKNGQNLSGQALRTDATPTPAPVVAQGSALPTPAVAGGARPAVVAPPMPQTEQGALSQMVQTAVGRQDTSSALMGALATLAKARTPLPAPVVKAMAQVLATRTDLSKGEISGKALQQAVTKSGVFQEALLARGDPAGAGDVKTALLGLRGALVSWLGSEGAAVVFGYVQRQPPMRGGVPRAQRDSRDPLLLDAGPDEIGKAVLERTDSALSRLRLHQNASLPDLVHKANAEWNMELPVNLGLQQSVLQLQISRDGGGGNGQAAERNWQMRFAIDLQSIGEVGAQVGLRGRKASVMLWAAEASTAEALREMLPGLYAELGVVGLEAGAITVRSSVPAPPTRAWGGFVDAMR